MTALSPAETLTAAARLLRERAAAIETPEPARSIPWHVEECSAEAVGECPCIVAQGLPMREGGPATAMYYIADAETPDVATWIALMHPGVGLALADWLDHYAEFLRGVEQTHGALPDLALHNSRHALAVARQLLGVEQ